MIIVAGTRISFYSFLKFLLKFLLNFTQIPSFLLKFLSEGISFPIPSKILENGISGPIETHLYSWQPSYLAYKAATSTVFRRRIDADLVQISSRLLWQFSRDGQKCENLVNIMKSRILTNDDLRFGHSYYMVPDFFKTTQNLSVKSI